MNRPPFFKVDFGAGARISAGIRKRNKEAYEELVENSEKISASLRAWQVALHRNTQWLEEFRVVE